MRTTGRDVDDRCALGPIHYLEPVTTTALTPQRVLADAIPGGLVRDAALVLGGTGLFAVSAQLSIPLWFTPVPLTLQTLAAVLVGAALGPVRGGLSAALYVAVGYLGVGWFAEHRSGASFASFGYLLGMVAAGVLVGWLASRGGDRTPVRTAGTMALGNLVIYAFGVPWLMSFAGVGFAKALTLGVTPFLAGDAIKIAVAAALLPAAWQVVKRVEQR
jgi:biotin transport system substrate-specific component